MSIEVQPLGAGQHVGRSCIIIKINQKRIMLDCGLHMGISDIKMQEYPNCIALCKLIEPFDEIIDVVLISHFHLDHCGALPYFSEILGYNGPIIMTSPTKAILPYMLEDFRKVMLDTKIQKEFKQQSDKIDEENQKEQIDKIILFSQENIKNCQKKIQVVQLHETIEVSDIRIKVYYAGHVLGACMFYIENQGSTVVYTGDFNSSADRHLGAAWIEKLYPDLLISESTYATTLRESKRQRERDFLQQVQETIDQGGKVLIPVFALGRAQELCILLETYWERAKNKTPIYFAAGMIDKANFYYRLFVNWTNEKIKSSFIKNNMFEFKYITTFDRNLIKSTMPMVLFATPGMLHAGLSMQVFKEWCNDPKNTLIIPGYCVAGTLGNRLLSGEKRMVIDSKEYEVKMKVLSMSFSAHADAKGIMQLIKHLEPQNVMLVHGEKSKMMILSDVIKENLNLPCYCPANFETVKIQTNKNKQVDLHIFQQKQPSQQGFLVKDEKDNAYFLNEQDFHKDLSFLLSILQNEQVTFHPHEVQEAFRIEINENQSQKILLNISQLNQTLEEAILNSNLDIKNRVETINSYQLIVNSDNLIVKYSQKVSDSIQFSKFLQEKIIEIINLY